MNTKIPATKTVRDEDAQRIRTLNQQLREDWCLIVFVAPAFMDLEIW